MRILIAPDKFKGSLSAKEVCQAIAQGALSSIPSLDVHAHPMADGGDGSLEVIEQHLKLQRQELEVADPLGRPISSFYYTSKKTAFIEMATASGLVLLTAEERDPWQTSTFGTGQMIADAIEKGCTEIFLFLGGSATNDGGTGMAAALGMSFFDKEGNDLLPCGKSLGEITTLSFHPVFDINKIKFTLLCDVNNPLCGPNGAAYVYARQKGADDEMIQLLDKGMKHFHLIMKNQTSKDVSEIPGAGAAGGIAASLVSFFNAELKGGTASIAKLTNLEAQIIQADLVITGEGKLDSQSLQGKVVCGVAKLCIKHKKPLLIFVGKNDLSTKEAATLNAKTINAIMDLASDFDDGMQNGASYLRQMAAEAILVR